MNMKAHALLAVVMALSLFGGGCGALDQISDEDLAGKVQQGAAAAIEAGVNLAISKYPDKVAAIKKELAAATLVIKANIIPSFMTPTGEVLTSAVKTAMALLESKITNEQIRKNIVLAFQVLEANVTLPENPLAKLDPRTAKALIGLFTGISTGLDAALSK
jgi:dihydrodipicolinate synthase/N-acetylneuraminate lyase